MDLLLEMLPVFTALQFRVPTERGLNRPFIALGVTDEGREEVLVVKPRAGYGDNRASIVRECFTTLWAQEIGVPVPEPVIVNIQPGFAFGASDYPEHAELIRQSEGLNFGTVHLGTDWKTWINASPPKSVNKKDLETIFAFDVLVQNADRGFTNPNLLFRGNKVTALDFDRSFAYLNLEAEHPRPWERVIGMLTLQRHCLLKLLERSDDQTIMGQDLWDLIEEWKVSSTFPPVCDAVNTSIDDQTLDLPKIVAYFTKFGADPENFFRCLAHAAA